MITTDLFRGWQKCILKKRRKPKKRKRTIKKKRTKEMINDPNWCDVALEQRVAELIRTEGLEGTEDLINRVLKHPDLHILKGRFLHELYRRYR